MSGAIQLANIAVSNSLDKTIDFELLRQFGPEMSVAATTVIGGIGFTAIDLAGIEGAAIVGLGALFGLIVFFVMLYVQIITIFIKFYLAAGFAYILMPFAGFDKTKDITMKALNGLFSQAVELYVLMVILKLADHLRDQGVLSGLTDGDYKINIFEKYILIIFLYMLITKAGTMASALMSGAIATLGIGATAGANGLSKAASARGAFNKDIGKASKENADKMNKYGETSKDGSATYKAATKISNGVKSGINSIKSKFNSSDSN